MHLRSLTLNNVKAFREQVFDFTDEDGDLAGFHVIVGGNASGKSTILRTIALGIAGPTAGLQLMKRTEGWIRDSKQVRSAGLFSRNAEERTATVKLTLERDPAHDLMKGKARPTKGPIAASVRWESSPGSRSEPLFRSGLPDKKDSQATVPAERGIWNPDASGWFAAGYGPMRRLTGSSPDAVRDAVGGGRVADFVTLFREDAALSESEEWLKNLQFRALEKDAEAGEFLASILELLNDDFLPGGARIEEVTSSGVMVRDPGGVLMPMREMSDGCRSAYALVLDILFRMASAYGKADIFEGRPTGGAPRVVANRPGIVLIDEVESHLHPSWQQSISSWLVDRFPRVQFIVTTHSPLIVQAAVTGTIHALPIPGEAGRQPRKLTGDERRRILLGRAEKVLLGSAFGLSETRSRWALARMEQYRVLEARADAGARLSPSDRRLLGELEKDMELAFEEFLEEQEV